MHRVKKLYLSLITLIHGQLNLSIPRNLFSMLITCACLLYQPRLSLLVFISSQQGKPAKEVRHCRQGEQIGCPPISKGQILVFFDRSQMQRSIFS